MNNESPAPQRETYVEISCRSHFARWEGKEAEQVIAKFYKEESTAPKCEHEIAINGLECKKCRVLVKHWKTAPKDKGVTANDLLVETDLIVRQQERIIELESALKAKEEELKTRRSKYPFSWHDMQYRIKCAIDNQPRTKGIICRLENQLNDKDARIADLTEANNLAQQQINLLDLKLASANTRIAELEVYATKAYADLTNEVMNKDMKVSELESQLKSARDNALEEAAIRAEKELVGKGSGLLEATGMLIAAAIRSLKTKGHR